jgi:hypothetical protein
LSRFLKIHLGATLVFAATAGVLWGAVAALFTLAGLFWLHTLVVVAVGIGEAVMSVRVSWPSCATASARKWRPS